MRSADLHARYLLDATLSSPIPFFPVLYAIRHSSLVRQLRDEAAVAQAARRDPARPDEFQRHDAVHLVRGEPEDNDEPAAGQEQEYPVRGVPRLQGAVGTMLRASALQLLTLSPCPRRSSSRTRGNRRISRASSVGTRQSSSASCRASTTIGMVSASGTGSRGHFRSQRLTMRLHASRSCQMSNST